MADTTESITLKGTAVVPGTAYAGAVWITPRPELPSSGPVVPEEERDGQYDRFVAAADSVAGRLEERAKHANGAASEVLTATAGLVRDRGWRKTVKKNINSGHPAEYAVVAATTKFISMFEAAGGVMAERTTVFAAFARSFRLSRGHFWRIAGIYVLSVLLVGIMTGIVSSLFSSVGLFVVTQGGGFTNDLQAATTSSLISGIITSLLQLVFTPFLAAVTTLIYTDVRMRTEGLDLALQRAAAKG